jgi:hypothetical protein
MGINAQTSVPKFTSGDVLTAANTNLLTNAPPVFSGTATRDAAFGGVGEKTLAEGQLCYLEDSNIVQYYDGAAWATLAPTASKIAQVVSTNLPTTFSTASTSYTDLTGLSVSITPTLNTSKVLVFVNLQASVGSDISVFFQLVRGSTAIDIGDAAGSRTRASFAYLQSDTILQQGNVGLNFLDSPATTSATTYKMQVSVNTGTAFINRTGNDGDAAQRPRTASNITVMEVLA